MSPVFEAADTFSWGVERLPGLAVAPHFKFEKSAHPRGLAIAELTVRDGHDGLFSIFQKLNDVYLTSVGFDLSGAAATVLPPEQVRAVPIPVRRDEPATFSLGDGVPLWGPAPVTGALYVYVLVSESDRTSRAVGERLKEINELLTKSDGIIERVKDLLVNPGAVAAKQVLGILSSAVLPLGTILADNQDDKVALFQGVFSATGGWEGRLTERQADCELRLRELG